MKTERTEYIVQWRRPEVETLWHHFSTNADLESAQAEVSVARRFGGHAEHALRILKVATITETETVAEY